MTGCYSVESVFYNPNSFNKVVGPTTEQLFTTFLPDPNTSSRLCYHSMLQALLSVCGLVTASTIFQVSRLLGHESFPGHGYTTVLVCMMTRLIKSIWEIITATWVLQFLSLLQLRLTKHECELWTYWALGQPLLIAFSIHPHHWTLGRRIALWQGRQWALWIMLGHGRQWTLGRRTLCQTRKALLRFRTTETIVKRLLRQVRPQRFGQMSNQS